LASPDVTFRLDGHNITSGATPQVAPARVEVDLTFRNDQLDLGGVIRLPSLQPLTFRGGLPLPLATVREAGKLAPDTPIRFSVNLPSSSAAIIPRFAPAVRYIDGTVSVDASVSGTLENPTFRGGLFLNIPALRFANANLPGVSN